MNNYYQGYELNDDIQEWMLSERNKRILDSAIYIVDNRVSIRECSRNMMCSKTTLHRCIHEELLQISYELYKCCIKQLSKHKNQHYKAS